eukprot:SAG11_NODE_4410_length_1908_cov_2.655058_2_plen_115_part_00
MQGKGGFEYKDARTWMTAEVVAAAEAALEGGASAVLISDSHGCDWRAVQPQVRVLFNTIDYHLLFCRNGLNIRPDALPTGCRLIRSCVFDPAVFARQPPFRRVHSLRSKHLHCA